MSENEEGGWWSQLPWQHKVSWGIVICMLPLAIYSVVLIGEANEYSEFEVEGVISDIHISTGGFLSNDLTQITFENGSVLALDGRYTEFALGDNVWIRVGVKGDQNRVAEWERRSEDE